MRRPPIWLDTVPVKLSGETLRRLVEGEGERVLESRRSGRLAVAWSALDCRIDPKAAVSPTRRHLGNDGVMAPLVSDVEKVSRRRQVKEKRRRRGNADRLLIYVSERREMIHYPVFQAIGMEDRRRPDRGGLQDPHRAAERLGHALGRRQCPYGPRSPDAKRPVGLLLAKSVAVNGLRTPGNLDTPRQALAQNLVEPDRLPPRPVGLIVIGA